MRKRDTYRYVICGRCGEKWNIARNQNTKRGYICPNCTGIIPADALVEMDLSKLLFKVTYQKGGRVQIETMTKAEFLHLIGKHSVKLVELEVVEPERKNNERKSRKSRIQTGSDGEGHLYADE